METKLEGVLSTWIAGRGFGFIVVTENNLPIKFYLHISRVLTGTPEIGSTVRFNVLPIREGNLPSAVDAEIVKAVL